MFSLESPETQFALQAVRRAAHLVKQVQAALVSPALTKDDRSPVTVADFAAQALVGHLLAQSFPADPLVGEEDASILRGPQESERLAQITRFVAAYAPHASPQDVCAWIDRGRADPARRFWTIDPIDGTKGFVRGDQYAVALALIEEGQVQIGALGCPNLTGGYLPKHGGPGSLVLGVRGQGAWVTSLDGEGDFSPLSVSNQADPTQARLLRSFESGHTNLSKIDDFVRALKVQVEPVRMDSQAKYAVLAAGGGELYLRLLSPARPDYQEKIWDQAAGSVVIEEAGGQVTDLDGMPLDFTAGRTLANNRGVLASNGLLHADALQALRAIHI
jgi:3'(2'), 5'-bisphosphate nucleotidase